MRTVVLAGENKKTRIVAAVDCDEVTQETERVLRSILLRRISAANPVAAKIAQESPEEIFDFLLKRGWKFETYEQFNEARIVEPQQEK